MTDYFFYGTLCHPPLLRVVAGGGVTPEPATLPGHGVDWARAQIFPTLTAAAGRQAQGTLLRDVPPEVAARLDFYEAGHGYDTRDMAVTTATGPVAARVFVPRPGLWQADAPFDLRVWAARYGAVVTEAAREVMQAMGTRPAAAVFARYPQILVRAASALRAGQGGPTTRRRDARPGDVVGNALRQPYAAFFAVEEADLRYRRFDGALGAPVTRAAFVSGDAATVLPWDPVRDRVLLVEQFRMGPHARGDAQPWTLEPVAGRVDPFESPEDCARREAQEEAGVHIGALHLAAAYYPSPGAKSEYLYSYVGIADLPDCAAGIGGLAEEGEDIRGHLVSFDTLERLIETGEAANGPLILTAQWLARHRDRLRPGG